MRGVNTENPIKRARDILGGVSKMASVLGVKPPTVSQWMAASPKYARPIPGRFCPVIERATLGAVTCEELRPDFDWAYLRGTSQKLAAE